ncbi:hypothetical protein A2960_05720 [Candidatus Gottesmanbacteria bacterium RIFCSPLOWO2_01_FULL_39_12b]|uniref:Uncharacterized protein n=1 Tax=Candidatus Gottesmanbacteria bacterium RIFCSPLOWO2_01_FULL_39_12b TaxID=1798388 RepID=A0A1F6AMW0_9BACT|nr:MAG: hypothetical protein A2960_05720 [Candidatus Gottesmanbacteria bacterium RIFCSPLOWO2_01_FULL_39_12b]
MKKTNTHKNTLAERQRQSYLRRLINGVPVGSQEINNQLLSKRLDDDLYKAEREDLKQLTQIQKAIRRVRE